MRGQELLDKMDFIEPAYVEAADMHVKKKKSIWLKWGAMAACIGITLLSVWATGKNQESSQLGNLQTIEISELSAGQGFEGYLCYDISELENGNPWSEDMDIKTLPVYKNKAYDASGAGVPKGLSVAEMMERLDEVLGKLGLNLVSSKTHTEGLFTTSIEAETEKGTVEVEADGTITYFPTKEELVISDCIEKYSAFLQMEEPEIVTQNTYNFYGDLYQDYKAYDSSGNEIEDILNYNFSNVQIATFENGEIHLVRKKEELLLANKVDDYPIVAVKEATKRLENGNYQSSVPYVFPGKEHIGKVELIYRTGSSEKYLLPYYRFYVELTIEELENGLKTYGAYYVPAVEADYIKNMPVYGGNYN